MLNEFEKKDEFILLAQSLGVEFSLSVSCALLSLCLWFTPRPKGSDCGVVNVNIPTNGAEIGGAFGT